MHRRNFFCVLAAVMPVSQIGAVEPRKGISEHLFPFATHRRFGFINRTGKVMIPAKFDTVDSTPEITLNGNSDQFSEGLSVATIHGRFGFIGTDGSWRINPIYGYARRFSEGLASVESIERPNDCIIIDSKGKVVIQLEGMRCGGGFSHGLAAVSTRDGSDYIRTDGTFATTRRFARADRFSEGLAGVRMKDGQGGAGKIGYIDERGDVQISPRFDEARAFAGGAAAVMVDGKWGMIQHDGQFLLQPKYAFIDSISDGIAVAKRVSDGLCEFIAKDGSLKIPGAFRRASPFGDGTSAVQTAEGWGIIGEDGRYVVLPGVVKCRAMQPLLKGLALVHIAGSTSSTAKMAYVDNEGMTVYEWEYSFEIPE